MNPKKEISLPTNNSFVIAMGNHKYYDATLYIYEQFVLYYNRIGGFEDDEDIVLPLIIDKVLSRREKVGALKLLVDNNFLIQLKYQVGIKPNTYKPVYVVGECFMHQVDNTSSLYKNIIRIDKNRKAHLNRLPVHLRSMYHKFMNLQFDYYGMLKWIDAYDIDVSRKKKKDKRTDEQYVKETKGQLRMAVFALMDKRTRYFKRNKTNYRLETNLTNLKKELKEQFMIGDFWEEDANNSQFYLLGATLENFGKSNSKKSLKYLFKDLQTKGKQCNHRLPLSYNVYQSPVYSVLYPLLSKCFRLYSTIHQNSDFNQNGEGLKLFIFLTKNGSFYLEIQRVLGLKNRNVAKEIMMQLAFSRNVHYRENKDLFATIFPFVENFIHEVKREPKHNLKKPKFHIDLAILLQSLESFIFIDVICPKLVEVGIVPLTVHDSIIIESKDALRAKQILENAFQEILGSIPSLTVKPLKLIT